jgi:xylulokinase
MSYIAGFDFGTGSLKATVMSEGGDIVAEYAAEYQNILFNENWAEQIPEVWWETFLDALQCLEAKFGIGRAEIGAISVTGQMRSLILLGKDGKPIRNAILWTDCRCEKQAAELAAKHEELIFRIAHAKLDPGCTLPKILWLIEQEKQSWEDTGKFVFPPDWIFFRLTGTLLMDRSMAAGTCLFDVRTNEWSREVLDTFGLEADKLASLADAYTLGGKIGPDVARETGLAQGTPIIVGGGDVAVETFATGIRTDEIVKIRLGSGGDISGMFDMDAFWEMTNWTAFTSLRPSEGIIGGVAIKSCAQTVKWIRNMFFSELPPSSETFAIMDREASDVPAGSHGVLFHPYLLGEYTPYYNSDIRAMFHGLSMDHERKHILRAAYEGLSFAIRDAMEAEHVLKRCDTVVAIGGGAKSELWMSLLADILDRNIKLPKYCDASYGAALIAGEGVGAWDANAVIDRHASDFRILRPNPDHVGVYNEIYPMFKQLASEEISRRAEKR